MIQAVATARLLLLCCAALTLLPCLAIPAEGGSSSDQRLNDPKPTTILVRVVGHGVMVLGREVGGARVTITDVATKQVLARVIHEHFCCNRQSAATTSLRSAGSPLEPSTYCTSTPWVLGAPRAALATRLSDFATNRHE
jgi:hypothetical protein